MTQKPARFSHLPLLHPQPAHHPHAYDKPRSAVTILAVVPLQRYTLHSAKHSAYSFSVSHSRSSSSTQSPKTCSHHPSMNSRPTTALLHNVCSCHESHTISFHGSCTHPTTATRPSCRHIKILSYRSSCTIIRPRDITVLVRAGSVLR